MNKRNTIQRWCEIFGVEIVDNDGFRGQDLKTSEISLNEFLKGISECTIHSKNFHRTRVMDALL